MSPPSPARMALLLQRPTSSSDAADAALNDSKLKEEALLIGYEEQMNASPPPGALEKYIIYYLLHNPYKAREYLICAQDEREGLIRFVHEEISRVVSDKTIARLRKYLLREDDPIYWFCAFMTLYTANEGIRRFVDETWCWPGEIGKEILSNVKIYLADTYTRDMTEIPFLPDESADKFMRFYFTALFNAIGMFDMRRILLDGRLSPVPIALSRNQLRKNNAEMTQRARETVEARRTEEIKKQQELAAADAARALQSIGAAEEGGAGEEEEEGMDEGRMDDEEDLY